MSILIRLIISGLSILAADYMLDSVQLDGFVTALIAGVILGLVNTFVRPVLRFFFAGITFLTFGLFILVINAITYKLSSMFVPGFEIETIWGAFLGAIITSVVSVVLNFIFRKAR